MEYLVSIYYEINWAFQRFRSNQSVYGERGGVGDGRYGNGRDNEDGDSGYVALI